MHKHTYPEARSADSLSLSVKTLGPVDDCPPVTTSFSLMIGTALSSINLSSVAVKYVYRSLESRSLSVIRTCAHLVPIPAHIVHVREFLWKRDAMHAGVTRRKLTLKHHVVCAHQHLLPCCCAGLSIHNISRVAHHLRGINKSPPRE